MTKLSTYIKPVAGGYRPPVETWELQDPNVQPDMALTWWVEQPQVVMPLMLTGAITVQDDRIGILDVHAWLFNTSQPRWEWRLNRDALSQVERHRRGQDLVIDIRLEGVASIPAQLLGEHDADAHVLWPITVSGTERFAQSDWARWLSTWKYNPLHELGSPLDQRHWPDWTTVQNDVQGALSALGRGEGHEALTECLSALEKIRTAPYDRKSWHGMFDVDDQKQEGLAALFAGLGTYLNKVGHHRSRTSAIDNGEHPKSPVDQWEAELAVTMSQLVLAYIRRAPRTVVEKS